MPACIVIFKSAVCYAGVIALNMNCNTLITMVIEEVTVVYANIIRSYFIIGIYFFKDCIVGIVCEVNDRTKNLIYRVNSFVTKDENNSQLLLGFRSNNYEEMTKWLILLNYFISEKNYNA